MLPALPVTQRNKRANRQINRREKQRYVNQKWPDRSLLSDIIWRYSRRLLSKEQEDSYQTTKGFHGGIGPRKSNIDKPAVQSTLAKSWIVSRESHKIQNWSLFR